MDLFLKVTQQLRLDKMLIEEGIVRRKGSVFFGAKNRCENHLKNSKKIRKKNLFVKIHLQLRLDRMLESEGVIGNEAGESLVFIKTEKKTSYSQILKCRKF